MSGKHGGGGGGAIDFATGLTVVRGTAPPPPPRARRDDAGEESGRGGRGGAGGEEGGAVGPPPTATPTPTYGIWCAIVAYDGATFAGFQKLGGRQDHQATIERELETALSRCLRCTPAELHLHAASRTDAGVHARGQVVHFRGPAAPLSTVRVRQLQCGANTLLPRTLRLRRMQRAPPGFNAQRDCVSKVYSYRLLLAAVEDPLLAGVQLHWCARAVLPNDSQLRDGYASR